ncbi:MAG: hypothetical protein AB1Z98_17175 [Nannocystaceae bacterium]
MSAGPRRLLALVLLAACRPEPTVDPGDTRSSDGPPPDAIASDPSPPPCEPAGPSFDDHRWAPATAPAIASIALADPQLPQALSQLAEHARGRGHGLPIPLAFSLSQWSWQVPTLVATLRQAGFAPAELVFVAGEDADHAWVWRSACDLDTAMQRIEDAWSLRARRVVEGMVAESNPPGFPYDVLALPGERFALVPAGRAAAVLQRWSRPAPSPGLGATAPGPGARLDAVEAAPVRLVTQGRALLDPTATAAHEEVQTLRVTATGVLAPPSAGADASLGDP